MVRSSLTSARRRVRSTAVAALIIALAGTTAAAPSQADDLKHKRKVVQRGIMAAEANLNETSHAVYAAGTRLLAARARLATAQHRLTLTRAHLTSARALDSRMKAALATAEKQLIDAQAQLDSALDRLREQRAAVGRLAAQSVQGTDPHLIGLVALMNDDDPTDLSTQMQAAGNVMDRQDRVLTDLRAAKTRLTVQEAKVSDARDQVAVRRKDAAQNLALRRTLAAEALQGEHDVVRLVGNRRDAQRAAEAARASDAAELRKLKKEDDRIAALILAKSSKRSFGNGPLLRPVTGYVTSPFGYRVHPIFGYYRLHNGTDFHAPCGTPVRAAGNGRVIAEYFQSAWGNRLIVDVGRVKGRSVSVIYNHLSGYRVGNGARVTRGETLGYAGTTGASTGCHLHFTVMVDGKPQNPMNWF